MSFNNGSLTFGFCITLQLSLEELSLVISNVEEKFPNHSLVSI